MSDFDFDELDKAVNSALGQQPSDATEQVGVNPVTSTEPAASTEASTDFNSINRQPTAAVSLHSRAMASNRVSRHEASEQETEAPVETPSQVSTESAALDTSENTTTSESNSRARISLPTRRSGRFMDVVHPSSDMRSRTATTPTSTPVNRVGTTLAAASQPSEVSSEVGSDVPTLDSSADNSATSIDTGTVAAPDLPANKSLESAINDLLVSEGHAPVVAANPVTEAPAAEDTIAETPAPEPSVPQISAPQPDSRTSSSEDLLEDFDGLKFEEILSDKASETAAPQTSPFIEGAKVDKRPLGGIDLGDIATSEAPAPAESVQDITEEPKSADSNAELERPMDVSAEDVLPEELDDTVVAIEAASAEDGAAPASLEIETEAPETPAPSIDEPKSDVGMTRGAYEGPTSIAKQYKEEPRQDDDSGDIFDTKTYHQPIKSDEKSHSMLPWIIAVVVLVLLVAGGVFFAWWSGILPSM